MNAVDEIQAAIDKLTRLKSLTSPSPWAGGQRVIWDATGEVVVEASGWDAKPTHVDLIVTLHATIDAQLAILHETLFQLSGAPQARGFIGNEFSLFARLAQSINGTTS